MVEVLDKTEWTLGDRPSKDEQTTQTTILINGTIHFQSVQLHVTKVQRWKGSCQVDLEAI
jgi:hypothetical protein